MFFQALRHLMDYADRMRLNASDLITLYRPDHCELRLYLRNKGEKGEPADPFQEILNSLGLRHEKKHLASLGSFVDLSDSSIYEQARRTKASIANKSAVLYQPAFVLTQKIGSEDVEIIGVPDFLIWNGRNYILRDSKMARRIDEENHLEILLQVQLYGWLYERSCGLPPDELQVHSGTDEIIRVPYDAGRQALEVMERILKVRALAVEPYEPVGWSKCIGCTYTYRCWTKAEESCDVARVYGIDQSLARTLNGMGVCTFNDLLTKFDENTLADLRRPWGKKEQRVGKSAEKILRFAEAMQAGSERVLAVPMIPPAPNYVMFDLEGMPPYLRELDKIYLWGMQVFGDKPGPFTFAVSSIGSKGDEQGWSDFLVQAKLILETYGDIPWVHWSNYEQTGIKKYIARYGDPEGIAVRVLRNLLDLLPVTREAVVLPLPSLSLKVIEDYVGFQRKGEEYGGTWAMATFIEATETDDEQKRRELMDKILAYNREDLEATWAVFQWLRSRRPPD